MSAAFVQAKTVQTTSASSITTASFVSTSGNFLAAGVGCNVVTLSGSPVSDSGAGTWLNAGLNNSGSGRAGIYYLENIAGSGSQTVTFTRPGGGSGSLSLIVLEFSQVATVSSLDKTAFTNSSSFIKDSGNTATTTQADELLLGIGGVNTGSDPPASIPGFFIDQISLPDNLPEGLLSSYSIVAATGAYTFFSGYGQASVTERIGISTFKGSSIAFVQSASATSSAATSLTTAGMTTTSGNFISAFGTSFTRTFSTTVGTQVSDNKGNTFLGAWAGTFAGQFYGENITGGSSHTFTLTPTGGSSACSFGVMEFSGIDASSSLDKVSSGLSSANPKTSGATATTSQANELLLGGSSQSHGTQQSYSTTNTGGLWNDVALADSSPEGLIFSWRLVSSTGAYNFRFTEGAVSVSEAVGIATFKSAGNDLNLSTQESLKISQSIDELLDPLGASVTDTLKVQDQVTSSGSLATSLTESLKIQDTPILGIDPNDVIRTENIKVHDTVTVARTIEASLSENVNISDIALVPAKTAVTQHSATVILTQPASTRVTQHSASIILAQLPSSKITHHSATVLRIKDPCAINVVYEDPCSISHPQFWVALVDENGNVTQAATRALRNQDGYYGGYTEPRLLSISDISRVASDWLTRSWQAQTATAVFADTDRIIRGLTRGDLVSAQFYTYLVDDDTRKNRGYQRLLFQGPVYTDALKEDLAVEVTANDVISIDYSLFADEKMIPQRITNQDDFPNCPTQTLGFGIPIIAGDVIETEGALLLYDVGEVTINSLTKHAFMVCGHAVHDLDLFQGGVAIPDADPHTWWPYSSTWTDIVPGGAKFVTIGGNDYTLVLVDGWRAAAIDGGSSLQKDSWAATTAYSVGDAVSPASNMVDGQSKFLLCTTAGTTGSSDTLTVPASGVTLTDGSVTWTAVSNEAAPIYANVKGFGTKADATGSEITNGIIQAKYILINWLLQSFKTGSWLASPKFESYPGNGDFICRVDTASFDIASEVASSYLVGGFIGGFVIGAGGQRQSVRQVWADILQSFNLMFCQSQYQQLKVVMLDRRREKFIGSSTTINDRRDILAEPRFSIQKKRDWLCNDFGYQYAPNYRNDNTGSWNGFNIIGNAPSKVKYGVITKSITYPMVRDEATADTIAGQQLDFRSQVRLSATYAQSLCGLKRDVLDGLSITHFNGRGSNGWQDNACWIISQRINQPNCSVTFEAIDVQDLISQYTTLRIVCPGNLVRTSSDGDPVVVTYSDPVVTGGRSPITGSYDIPSGSEFEVGITGVTYTAVSADGQTVSCSFTVTVNSTVSTHHLTVTNGSGDGDYLSTDVISVSADPPPPGQMFSTWTGGAVADSSSPTTTISISVDTTLVAHYVDLVGESGQITIGWDPNPEEEAIEGYVVQWGTVSGVYTNARDAGDTTTYVITGLVVGLTYYISIQAYNAVGYSGDATEVSGVAVATP